MATDTPATALQLSKEHLERVLEARDEPDWANLSMFGLYCLEAAVKAAALKVGIYPKKASHAQKQDFAEQLAKQHGLPDISDLLADLNEIRKSEAYGDIENPPELDAADVSGEIEAYVKKVAALIGV